MTAKKLEVIAENLPLGGFEDFHGVLFERLLDFGFKPYVVDVSMLVQFCRRRLATYDSNIFANKIFSKFVQLAIKKQFAKIFRSSSYF